MLLLSVAGPGPAARLVQIAPYRARAVADPRDVLKEFGTELGEDVEIRVWDSTSEVRYLVLPERPPKHRGLERGAPRRTRDPQLHDRGRKAETAHGSGGS